MLGSMSDDIARYLERVGKREGGSVWSAERFTVEPLRAAIGDGLAPLLDAIAQTMEAGAESRFEQYAVPSAARALAHRPRALQAIFDGALGLQRAGVDPGWYVQIVVGPLAIAAPTDEVLATAWRALVGFAIEIAGTFAGYPMGTGLAALLERGELAALPDRLVLLAQLTRAAKRDAYGLFEYGLAGLARGQLDEGDLTDALQLAIAMFDHGLVPAPTLAALHHPMQLDIATRLAKAGVDPALVITNGVRMFDALGWLDDGGDRLVELATELHRRGLRPLLFDDGLDILLPLEQEYALAGRALDLIEAMVERDLEPAILMRWYLPRTLGRLRPTWAAAELLDFARALVEHGVAPEPAIGYAAPALVGLATDAEAFRTLAGSVVALVTRLHALGIDHREVLFHDVAHLAEAGGESQTFGELLTAFAELVAAWPGDATELLGKALPVAARESQGRPWVLAIALRAATRLGRDGRAAEALSLLAVGVTTAAQLGTDNDSFAEALDTVEARFAALPPVLLSHASLAAGVLAGTDVVRLDGALAAVGAAHARHGPALVEIAPALPDLARIARDPAKLVTLVDELVTRGAGARAPRLAMLAAQAGATADDAPFAAMLTWLDGAPDRTLDRFGDLARHATPASLPALVAFVHGAFEGLADRRPLVQLLEHARSERTIRQMCELVPPLLREEHAPILDGLYYANNLVARNPHGWTYLVAPALVTAKQHATALLRACTWLPARGIEREEDLAVVRDIITQRGMRAVDDLVNLVAPGLSRGVMTPLAGHRERLDSYLRLVGFADIDVYARFVELGDDTASIAALRAEITDLVGQIKLGEVTEVARTQALFGVALQHVFPASVSATRAMWLGLVEQMPDRPGDVTALFPHGVKQPLAIAAGDWELAPDARGLECFAWAERVLPADATMPRDPIELGWDVLTAWSEGRLAREPARTELTRALVARADHVPPANYNSAAQLRAIRELAADVLAQLVEEVVVAARMADGERADRLIRTRLAPAPRIGPGLVKAVAKTLAGPDATLRLANQLQAFELPADAVELLRTAPDLKAALAALPARRIELEPGKELGRIHADLVGQELAQMTAALDRVLVYRASATTVELELEATKRAVHAPIGLTAGVCVATDLALWNTPGFMHLALWLEGTCAGSVHLLVVEEDGARYLALPGINPTLALLDRVRADTLVRALLARLVELSHEAGLAGVWIPTAPGIHSNRRAVHDALVAMQLEVRSTRGHAFSYSPYAYRIDDVWMVCPK
jgi:hypothetical protein